MSFKLNAFKSGSELKAGSDSKQRYLFADRQLNIPHNKYLSYVTPESVASTAFNCLNYLIPLKQLAVWDVCAGVGTDSLRLGELAGKVIATEPDHDTYKCLVQNTSPVDNITTYCGGYGLYEKLKHTYDLAYVDPPWGDNFISGQPFDLNSIKLSGTAIMNVIEQLRTTSPVFIKLPYLCDTIEHYYTHTNNVIIGTFGFSQQKLKFVLLARKE